MYTRDLPGGDVGPPVKGTIVRPWNQRVVGGVAGWSHRDGATLCVLASGRLLFIGGWDTDAPWTRPPSSGGKLGEPRWDAGGHPIVTTNEVWASDDGGVTWQQIRWDP